MILDSWTLRLQGWLKIFVRGILYISLSFPLSLRSSVCFIDRDKGILRYRGYNIEDLAENCSFLEVAYLLIHGNLPCQVGKKKSSSKATQIIFVWDRSLNEFFLFIFTFTFVLCAFFFAKKKSLLTDCIIYYICYNVPFHLFFLQTNNDFHDPWINFKAFSWKFSLQIVIFEHKISAKALCVMYCIMFFFFSSHGLNALFVEWTKYLGEPCNDSHIRARGLIGHDEKISIRCSSHGSTCVVR